VTNLNAFGRGRGYTSTTYRGALLYYSNDVMITDSVFEDTIFLDQAKRAIIRNNNIKAESVGIQFLRFNNDAQHVIDGNTIKAGEIGIDVSTTDAFEWETTLPTKIINNNISAGTHAIRNKFLMYLQILNNRLSA